jgi:hypothetical protein
MADIDLKSALEMFQSGAKQLMLGRAVGQANDQVNQIRASDASEQDKRNQLTGISQNLVAHMAAMGTPDTTMQLVANQFGPKQYKDANAMKMDSQLTGNPQLGAEATQQQSFENNKAFELAKMKYAAKLNGTSQLGAMRLENEKDEFNIKQNDKYAKAVDMNAASSRTQFGQWANVDGRGDRVHTLLGDPNQWKSMNPQALQLAIDSSVQMAKGGVATKEEADGLQSHSLALMAAQKAALVTGKPATVDLTGYAQLYNGVAEREGSLAKEKVMDSILNTANAHVKQGMKDGASDQFKLTTAKALGQIGIQVDPNTIGLDGKNGVKIPEIQGALDKAAAAPKLVSKALSDAKNGDAGAMKFLSSYGITPTTDQATATRIVRSKLKAGAFGP